jgi:ribosomal protein S18 acetylase RimI-like enzyme
LIRPIERRDVPVVGSLQERLPHADPEVVEAAVEGPFYGFVAVEDRPVGYAIALPGRPATLTELVVDPTRRRRGHGRALVERVFAATGPPLAVSTPVGNEAATRLYAETGFAVEGVVAGFYADGTDALRLVRRE